MPKILYFYPNNPLQNKQGNNTRAMGLLDYFAKKKMEVDFVGESKPSFTTEAIEILKQRKLIKRGHLIPAKKNYGLGYLLHTSIPHKFNKFPRRFKRLYHNQVKYFQQILEANQYDFILISYMFYAEFISNTAVVKNAITIVDTHDFFTAQLGNIYEPEFGNLFRTEMRQLDQFDMIWAISAEEKYVFSQFLPNKKVILIPHGAAIAECNTVWENKAIDVLYVASSNSHNVQSAQWFFSEVYPILDRKINIHVVGAICDHILDFDSVTKHNKVDGLHDLYQKAKLTICPMQSGTGLKVKVVESLSYGIPVVCNERGIDGLLSKIDTGCLVTNCALQFANNITLLVNDAEFHKTHATAARLFFSKTLHIDKIHKSLDALFLRPSR